MTPQKIGLIGAGAWGTAMGALMAQKGLDATMWAYEKETVESINKQHENKIFLPGIPLPENLTATNDLMRLVNDHDIIIAATPSHIARAIAQQIKPVIRESHRIIIASKGIEQHSLTLMSDVFEQELNSIPTITVLSGPTFAQELAQGLPTGAVLACQSNDIGKELQQILRAPNFRVYLSEDIVGVQIGGTVKNVIAIATGISDGMGLGLNARSALICRGLAEMKRLGVLLGAQIETFAGMSGIGDLVLTATGNLSRNYSLGVSLGKGKTLAQYMETRQSVAEGVKNAVSIRELTEKFNVDMPICSAVYDILHNNLTPKDALLRLLGRNLPEREFYR